MPFSPPKRSATGPGTRDNTPGSALLSAIRVCLRLTVLLLLVHCAAIKSPDGGPKDVTGPVLQEVDPPNRTRQFQDKSIVFHFDEYLRRTNPAAGVFISPRPRPRPEIFVVGRRLHIQFRGPLQDSTTYVVTLGDGIKDHHEGNPLADPVQFAFSTGPVLDTLELSGEVRDAFTREPVEGMLVMLYESDSVRGNHFRGLEPKYVSRTNLTGFFRFGYLRVGDYRLLGVMDGDQTFTLSRGDKLVALADQDRVQIDTARQKRTLLAYHPDTMPPQLNEVGFLNRRNGYFRFSEAVVSARLELGDTTLSLTDRGYDNRQPDPARLRFHLPAWVFDDLPETPGEQQGRDSLTWTLRGVEDTTGNRQDTTLRLAVPPPDTASALTFTPLPAGLDPFIKRYYTPTPLDSAQAARWIYLTDTADSVWQLDVQVRGYEVALTRPAQLDTGMTYQLVIDSQLVSVDGFGLDSTLREPYRLVGTEGLSALRGRMASTHPQDRLIIFPPEGKPIYWPDRTFDLPRLKPGVYRFAVFRDLDHNGLWTPGRLHPRRPPEPIRHHPEPLELRPNWQVEGFVVE